MLTDMKVYILERHDNHLNGEHNWLVEDVYLDESQACERRDKYMADVNKTRTSRTWWQVEEYDIKGSLK